MAASEVGSEGCVSVSARGLAGRLCGSRSVMPDGSSSPGAAGIAACDLHGGHAPVSGRCYPRS